MISYSMLDLLVITQMSGAVLLLKEGEKKQLDAGIVQGLRPHGPAVCEHIILSAGLSPNRKVQAQPLTQDEASALLAAVQECDAWFGAVEHVAPKGYIALAAGGLECQHTLYGLNLADTSMQWQEKIPACRQGG